MSKQTRASHPIYNLLPTELEGFDSLAELALDLHWSWTHATDEVWRQLDPELWEITHNPWVVLQTVSRDQIERVLADPVFRKNVDGVVEASRQAARAPAWFQRNHSGALLTCAAYFSMEFMLSEALPIYSGGLGNVAGDQLKAASDLGVPVVGVGLLYQQGYFRQVIYTSSDRLYSASDTSALRSGGSVGIRSNPMATMMKTPNASCIMTSGKSPRALTFGRALLCPWEPRKG
ncbi:MAG TPA: DUF3417 domain-containing protein [Terriglobales bacterium]|jgi:starch phosphorylase